MEKVKEVIWGMPTLCMLLGTGIYLTWLLRGLTIKKLPLAIRMSIGHKEKLGSEKEKGISSTSSLATELAATIGTGNIIGVACAMTMGGPGALFWMMMAAILGLATKLVESTLSVKYRIKSGEGLPLGGPMVTLARAFPLPRLGKILGWLYAMLCVLCSMGMGNLVQANAIGGCVQGTFGIVPLWTGMVLSAVTIFIIIGGLRGVTKVTNLLVPAMGALYLAGCLGVIMTNYSRILPCLKDVLISAFFPKAFGGGMVGILSGRLFTCMRQGISRGVFSNEAGMGAGGISAAASKESSHVKQGLISMTGVFYDTILICGITGLAFVVSGVANQASSHGLFLRNGNLVTPHDGAGMMAAAFEGTYGRYGNVLLTICIVLFAYATIIGWEAQGERAFTFLTNGRWLRGYRTVYAILTLFGAVMASSIVWDFADVVNGLMIWPNLICVLALAPGVCAEIRNYKFS